MASNTVHKSAGEEILPLAEEVYRRFLALTEENKQIVIRQIEILIDSQSAGQ